MAPSDTLTRPAIARLLTAYLSLRGVSQRRLARLVDTDVQRIAHLLRGSDYKGVRTLGIIARSGKPEPLLLSIARVLEIPHDEVAAAVMADLGFESPVSSGAPYIGGVAQW